MVSRARCLYFVLHSKGTRVRLILGFTLIFMVFIYAHLNQHGHRYTSVNRSIRPWKKGFERHKYLPQFSDHEDSVYRNQRQLRSLNTTELPSRKDNVEAMEWEVEDQIRKSVLMKAMEKYPKILTQSQSNETGEIQVNTEVESIPKKVAEETKQHLQNQTKQGFETTGDTTCNYRRAHPYGTDPDNVDPTIYITSLTELQPLNWRWLPEGTTFFEHHCPNLQPWMKCHYTQFATLAEINRSHALLFHVRHMSFHGSPKVKSFQGLPTVRHPHQKWVFYEPEAPTNTWNYANISAPYWTLFNLTATFTMDSDIPVLHHKNICKPRKEWQPTGLNYAGNKSLAAWFVSHCICSSKREMYVNEMMKYMDIDVYGECGNKSVCNRNKRDADNNPEACMVDLLTKHYKFYLSFENAFCTQYVTEKFHRMIQMVDVVPVVMGAADYINILPRGSYIDVRDFKSPRQLAEFLLKLDKDDALYNQYIERKKSYECLPMLPFGCSLCEYLHNHRYETQLVYDAASFWSVKQRCTDPRDFFRGIADEVIPNIHFNITPSLFL